MLSSLVSMESEKRAIQDFNIAVNSEAKGQAFLPLPTGRPIMNMTEGGLNDLEFRQHRKTEI
jgi:transcriptional regulator of met regulon